ncbi:hypothetical protein D9M71_327370 [compost metagenome]
MTGHAFHQDHNDVLDRQGLVGRRGVIATYRCGVGIHQFIGRYQQHVTHHLLGLWLRQGRLPDIVAILGHPALGGGDQRKRTVETQLVGEVGICGVDITPAHRRALAQGATGRDDADQQANHEHANACIPRRNLASADAAATERATRAGRTVCALERQAQDPGAHGPCQQVADHGETVPEHAHHGFRIFLDVLEDQAVETLVELTIEVHLHQAQEQRNAGDDCQPETEQPACGHGPDTEQ